MSNIKNKIGVLKKVVAAFSLRHSFPGFHHMSLYDVGVFFIQAIKKGTLSIRSGAIAYNFFLAIFPAILFIFTLIPYVPIDNFQSELLEILRNIMPGDAFSAVEGTIEDVVMNPRFDLLSVGFIMTMYFATNGVNAIMKSFNATSQEFETRSGIARRLISLWLVVIFFTLITLAILSIMFSVYLFDYLASIGLLQNYFIYYLLKFVEWIIIIALFFFAISFLYYYAPAKKMKWKLITAGGSIATLLCIIISLLFSFYVNNFGQYNKLYGSLGTIIVLMMWIYMNAMVLLIGFELNASIENARRVKKNE
ncbi:MAG: hypothetical protein A2W91_04685 [Bacteroidetes bacterium GWF2_38_335]|nr:MAG: hypothetical protein A2W91_04685 [Bacteroidetes bacterium GWF2_38_335]OFY80034.1 MAG: hypothetical protein A2281_12170 [Bacteroidetes bacterium RIFOXYA12_FULL_38_20]HBS85228.1 YihY/virulence factor BrkB family protein [Bacteroidales bacterium]